MNRSTVTTTGGGVTIGVGTLRNCTIATNRLTTVSYAGGGVHRTGGSLANCIVWGNVGTPADYSGTIPDVVSYSCAPELISGTSNITANPLFANPASGDYHLQMASPCIYAGVTQAWMAAATDLDGVPRLYKGKVDMGAYQQHLPPPPAGTVLMVW